MKKNTYQIRAIRTKADYQAALQEVAPYFDNEPEIDSDAGAHLEAMITLIEAYEAKHYPITPPDPIEALKFRMEQQGLKPKALEIRGTGQGTFGTPVSQAISELRDEWD